ncbi:hypothetical protein E24_00235 [Faustovirus]|nr:hypothetical protein PRJ_Fausto_00220 [Faustovirus]AMN83163.1 hypothetical protein E24_00235 [Faustovirus]AMN84143.1 hypothetical protein D5a_00233 [Faustovirus]AMN85132.1 hypothetical protein E23_00234 [Faustovirus]QBR99128.1 hypothetical protein [Faustovirus mariensis]
MRDNKCQVCDGKKTRKTQPYCKTCKKELENFIPVVMLIQHDIHTHGREIDVMLYPDESSLTITCDQFDDILTTQENLLVDLHAELDAPVVFNDHEYIIKVVPGYENPVVINESSTEGNLDDGNVRFVWVNRYRKKFSISMRKLTPEELAARQQ